MSDLALPVAVSGFALAGVAALAGVLSVGVLGLSAAYFVLALGVAFAAGCCGVYGVTNV